jgi:integrase
MDALHVHNSRDVPPAIDRNGPARLDAQRLAGTSENGREPHRAFRLVIAKTDLDPKQWTPRELRHSFMSLLSDQGIPLDEIFRLVGHRSTAVTELVYRLQIRPVLQEGATAMDRIFKT